MRGKHRGGKKSKETVTRCGEGVQSKSNATRDCWSLRERLLPG